MRRRLRALLVTALVLGVLGGVSLAAFAGARRTASAYPRFLRAGNPSHLSINNFSDEATDPGVFDDFPEVEATSTWLAFNIGVLDGTSAQLDAAEFNGSLDGEFFTQDRVGIIDGRLADPDALDEVVVNEYAQDLVGVGVGDVLHVGVYTDEQLEDPAFFEDPTPPYDELDVTIVGIALFPEEVVQDESDGLPRFLLTPRFTQQEIEAASYGWQNVILRDGDADIPAVQDRFLSLLPEDGGAVFRVHSMDVARAQRAVRPLSLALAIFGAVAAAAALALVGQAVARQVRSEATNDEIIRALGASTSARRASAALLAMVPIFAGAVLAVGVAVVLSPIGPIGPARKVEADPGISFDWTVLGLGAFAFALVLSVLAAATILTQSRATASKRARVPAPSRLVGAAAAAGLSPAAIAGSRLALEPGRGTTAVPVRSVMAGTAMAIAALVAALCFAASLDALVGTPRLYGWNWDATLLDTAGYGFIDVEQAHELFDDDERIDAWTGVYFGSDNVDGLNVPLLGVDPVSTIVPPILSGRTIVDDGEIVVGAGTLAALGRRVGDDVQMGDDATLRIVGTASFPTIGQTHGNHPSLGVGAMVAVERVPGALTESLGPNAVFMRFSDGTDGEEARAWLREVTQMIGEYPGSTLITDVLRPAEIVNSDDMGTAPALLAGALGIAALASLALALSVSTQRRRRDLALLKALGFTRRQVSAVVAWQATVTVAVGLLVGVPVGVAAGSGLWRLFARQLYVVPAPVVPVLAIAVLAVAVVALSNLAAAAPGRTAGRTPAAVTLRVE